MISSQLEEETSTAIIDAMARVSPAQLALPLLAGPLAFHACCWVSVGEQQRDELLHALLVARDDVMNLEEERELNFTLLMSTFSRLDQLAKVRGEE